MSVIEVLSTVEPKPVNYHQIFTWMNTFEDTEHIKKEKFIPNFLKKLTGFFFFLNIEKLNFK